MQLGQLRKAAGQAPTCPKKAADLSITLNTARGDHLAASSVLAHHHCNVMVLIQKHAMQLKRVSYTLSSSHVTSFGEAGYGI